MKIPAQNVEETAARAPFTSRCLSSFRDSSFVSPRTSSAPSQPPPSSSSTSAYDDTPFLPRRVLVTVGTTSFDALIDAVLDPAFLLLLLSRGCRRLVLQFGRGKSPALSFPRRARFSADARALGSFTNASSPSPRLLSRERTEALESRLPASACLCEGAAENSCQERGADAHEQTEQGREEASTHQRSEGGEEDDSQGEREVVGETRSSVEELGGCQETEGYVSRGAFSAAPGSQTEPSSLESQDCGAFRVSLSDLLSLLSDSQGQNASAFLPAASASVPSSDVSPRGSSPSLLISFFRFVPSLEAEVKAANLVLSHCGAGTVFQTLRMRKRLVAVVNTSLMSNHQLELGRELQRRCHCLLVSCLGPEPHRPHGHPGPGAPPSREHPEKSPSPASGAGTSGRAGQQRRGEEETEEFPQELHTRVKQICQAVWSSTPAVSLTSANSTDASLSAVEHKHSKRLAAGPPRTIFRSLLGMLRALRSQGDREEEGEEEEERTENERREDATAAAADAVRRGEVRYGDGDSSDRQQEPCGAQESVVLVPLPPADLSGFYEAVRDTVGLHPVYGDSEETVNVEEE
ncbi:glycosyltransferase family 28 C-terminal domain-containing protein [Toxoplasma gondii GAB2-2007-GAL-DOM2]|uniref:UDP-N-acetylglucosamine transferase subunit ALG13 n=3 Tax=Toxoplasma gondii TaxID=5811 RepID=A0A086LD83_TOXGO|nr:glycosyltransferase family 28 C-terminal domain-containing protein [Toxoplasma gondii GAB2-2007-GAL-DOM2]KFG54601.1 glycosyltransferase family 28 C-terminal domain-containing protein [Toxoplasma gondii FOU]RQX75058.1 glycosyltransferase family 28 C-terminal domain-containing protein [Toxoplasma gondii CAST]